MHQGQHGVVDDAHLRAVAVGHDDLVSLGDQVYDGLGGDLYGVGLLVQSAAQSVAAQCDNDFLRHSCLPQNSQNNVGSAGKSSSGGDAAAAAGGAFF